MYLGGQAGRSGQRGYAMAALLVSVSIMAIVMSALLPVWKHQARREKEAEMVFRGEQYARAIRLFRAKNGQSPPPNIDVLVQGRYIRKKYKDPFTGEDFLALSGQQAGATTGQPQGTGIIAVVSKSKETSIRNYRGATTYNQFQYVENDGRGPRYARPGAPPGPGGRAGGPDGRGGPGGRGPGTGQPGVGPGAGRGIGPGTGRGR